MKTHLESFESDHKKMPIRKAVEIEKQGYGSIVYSKSYSTLNGGDPLILNSTKMHNRLEFNKHLCSKKKLFENLRRYYESIGQKPFNFLPLTFHIKHGENDANFLQFQSAYNEINEACSEKL